MARVLHCLQDLHVGGVARLLLINLAHLDGARFDSRVCQVAPRDDLAPSLAAQGVRLHTLGHAGRMDAPRTLARFVRLLRREQIDLIHTHLFLDRVFGGLAARLCGVPVVTTIHTASREPSGPFLRRSRSEVERAVGQFTTDRFLAVSETVRGAAIASGLSSEQVTVVRSGVPAALFESPRLDEQGRRAARRRLGLDEGGPVILNVGRLDPAKGQRYLVEAMGRVRLRRPEVRLWIAGEGAERPSLEELISQRGLSERVRLLGQRPDVNDLLAASDLFAFPSVSEGLPMALVEAMAMACPFVASDIEPLREAVGEAAAETLVPARDPEALAQRILERLEDPAGSAALGERARSSARSRFEAGRSARELAAVYEDVLQRRGRSW